MVYICRKYSNVLTDPGQIWQGEAARLGGKRPWPGWDVSETLATQTGPCGYSLAPLPLTNGIKPGVKKTAEVHSLEASSGP